ncbi:MAG: hypothetical protein AUI10_10605 [Actinobacteria bacterium 13_2_20CM_2_72_6]|nr:MAG: hypothetical protein AUI10_10605 [Actinobacteria bacterium 13_2_20CM_2_72_6]
MTDERVLLPGRHEGDVVQVVPHRHGGRGVQGDADDVAGSAGPAGAGPVGAPRAVHAQVRVQRQEAAVRGFEAEQQVLAATSGLPHGRAGEVGGRQRRYPEVGGGQPLAGQRLVQRLRGVPDGVAFGHATILQYRRTAG